MTIALVGISYRAHRITKRTEDDRVFGQEIISHHTGGSIRL